MALSGIDISNYQRGLDLSKVPCDFAICKATEGTSIVHDTCDPWVQQAKELGKKWGFYHFAAGGDAISEADFFVENTENYFGEGIPVLDYEMYGRKGTAWVKRFLDRVYEKTSVRCMVYTSRSVLTEEDWSAIAPYHALWVAQYANNNPTGYQSDPWFPKGSIGGFKAVTLHQYSSTGRLDGYDGNLDLDIAYLTREGWDAIARGDREGQETQEPQKPEQEAPEGSMLDIVYHVVTNEINGDARREYCGSRYDEVQGFIDETHNASASTLAEWIKAGKYGNNPVRQTVIEACGGKYAEAQGIVNGAGKTYTVKSGDTLSAIASRNGTTVSAIMAKNPSIRNANLIYAGQVIRL